MKWVKDKVPENNNLVHIRFTTGKNDFKLTGFYEPPEKKWYGQYGKPLEWAPNLEWLDESEKSFTIKDIEDAYDTGWSNGYNDNYDGPEKYLKQVYNIDV